MSKWDFRIVKIDDEYEVREVRYNVNDEPVGHSVATAAGEDRDEVLWYVTRMLLAFEHEVLIHPTDFVGDAKDEDEKDA